MIPRLVLKPTPRVPAADRPIIKSSRDAYNILKPLYPAEQMEHVEFFYAVYTNIAARVIGYEMLSKGGLTGTLIDVRVVIQYALLCNATSILVSHNHPSGNMFPSDADRNFTKKLRDACDIMDMTLTDHIIVTNDGYYSFTDNNM